MCEHLKRGETNATTDLNKRRLGDKLEGLDTCLHVHISGNSRRVLLCCAENSFVSVYCNLVLEAGIRVDAVMGGYGLINQNLCVFHPQEQLKGIDKILITSAKGNRVPFRKLEFPPPLSLPKVDRCLPTGWRMWHLLHAVEVVIEALRSIQVFFLLFRESFVCVVDYCQADDYRLRTLQT
eukprot:1353112-Amorphochlora_amoeboformis.AAC.1